MGKKSRARRGGSGPLASPRGKQAGQEEPVADTVMQVIARRIRNAKKKLQKVTVIEALVQDGTELNDDQERVYLTKTPLTAIIEELGKLEPLVETALRNELDEQLEKAKGEWKKTEREEETMADNAGQPTDVAVVTSEGGESETTVEGPLTMPNTMQEEEEVEQEAEEESVASPEPSTAPATDPIMFELPIESLYFVELFAKDRFDLTPFLGDASQSKEAVVSQEEAELLQAFGKRIFKNASHVPMEALESARETAKELLFQSSQEARRIAEIVTKLKNSEAVESEVKLTVHGFPVPIEKEVSDTTTDRTDKSEEKSKQESQTLIDNATAHEPPSQMNENPPSSSPVHLVGSPYFVHMPHSVPTASKASRPFLPFPQVDTSGPSSVGFGMTQTPNIVGMHSYYGYAPVPGHFITPPPYPTAHLPPMHASTSPQQPPVEEQPLEETLETSLDPKDVEDDPAKDPEVTVTKDEEEVGVIELSEEPESVTQQELVTSTPEAAPEAAASRAMSKPRETVHQYPRPAGGGRFTGGHPAHSGNGGDYRPWQGRGRHMYPARGGPRGRGPRGRSHYPYSGPPRRAPFNPNQPPPHRPHFNHPSGGPGPRGQPFDPRGRPRRDGDGSGGYDRRPQK